MGYAVPYLLCSYTYIMAYLKVSGTKIVDQNEQEVILRGAGLGGWMKYVRSFVHSTSTCMTLIRYLSMENFISGESLLIRKMRLTV